MGKREHFLLCMLAGLFIWQAGPFTYGVHICSKADIKTVCPDLGQRYDNFVQTTLGAVLGLLAGSQIKG